jgi:molecular chaperone GrpE
MIKNKKKKKENQNVDDVTDNLAEKEIKNEQAETEETKKNAEEQVKSEENNSEKIETKVDNEIEILKKNIEELNDKYLRLLSDYDNFRKRTLREKADLIKSASSYLLTEFLPVADDFDRALEAVNNATDIKSVAEGLNLIKQKFTSVLTRNGVEPIKSIGEKFDVDFHEALTTQPTEDESKKGIIVDEIQKGYILNGKVLRYSKVVVAG